MSYNGSGAFSINTSGQPVQANTTIESAVFNALMADIATGLSTCLLKDGQQTVTANIPMGGYKFTGLGAGSGTGQSLRYEQLFTTSAVTLLGALDLVKGADVASASTTNLTTATGNAVHITGTTTITAVTLGSGMWRLVVFDGVLTLTHHSTNNNLPGAANITTAAGDRALYWADGTTVYCAIYMRASGEPVSPFVDTNPIVKGSSDATKKVRLEVDGLTTGTTRVLTIQDSDHTLVGKDTTDILSNKTLSSPVASGTITGTYTVGGTPTIAGAIISGAAPATPTSNVLYTDSVVKGWTRFTGTGTVLISDDLNVSSITDNGTGDYTVNWATSFASANYAVNGWAQCSTNPVFVCGHAAGANLATGSARIGVYAVDGAARDAEIVCVIAIGDN